MNWLDKLSQIGAEAYRGLAGVDHSPPAADVQIISTDGTSIAVEIASHFAQEELSRAKDDFQRGLYEEAALKYEHVLNTVPSSLDNSNADELRRTRHACMLGAATARMNLQELDAGRAHLDSIDEEQLSSRQRCIFALALAQLGRADRANSVLASASAGREPDALFTDRYRQLVMLAVGQRPDALEESADVLLAAASQEIEKRRLSSATDLLLRATSFTSEIPLLRATIFSALVHCFHDTAYEEPAEDYITDEQVRRVLGVLPGLLDEVLASRLPPIVRERALATSIAYAELVFDQRLAGKIEALFAPETRSRLLALPSDAIQLARDGRISVALQLVPSTPHPWRDRLQIVRLYAIAREYDNAEREARELATRFPNRWPIAFLAAQVLLNRAHADEALHHADFLSRSLPVEATVLLLAECLFALGRPSEALITIEPYAADSNAGPGILDLAAQAADITGGASAVDYWSRLAKIRAKDPSVHVRLGLSLSRSGLDEEAVRAVLQLLDWGIESLTQEELHNCGLMLLSAQEVLGAVDAVRHIAEVLRRRFADSDDAELSRLALLSGIGFPTGTAPIDYERLALAGKLHATSAAEIAQLMRGERALGEAATRLYDRGWVSFAAFCELTGQRPASWISRVTSLRELPGSRLRTPFGTAQSPAQIEGRSVLMSQLELLLLHVTGVLEQFVLGLGKGRIVLFDDAWQALHQDRVYLEHAARRLDSERLRKTLAIAGGGGRWIVPSSTEDDDAALAARLDVPFVTWKSSEGSTEVGSWLTSMQRHGYITLDDMERALHALGIRREEFDLRHWPNKVMVDATLLEHLVDDEFTEDLFRRLEAVYVGPRSLAALRQQHRDLKTRTDAADLVSSLHRALGDGHRSGWLAVTQRPDVKPLLPSVQGNDAVLSSAVLRSLADMLSYKEALAAHPSWLRVTAEHFGSVGISTLVSTGGLAWSRDGLRAVWDKIRAPMAREYTVPEVVRRTADSKIQRGALRRLAELGVQDAIGASDIADIAAESGLGSNYANELLTKWESAGDSPWDTSSALARISLAHTAAQSIWQICCAGVTESDKSRENVLALLARAVRLDERCRGRYFEQVVEQLLLHALQDIPKSVVAAGDNRVAPSVDTPAGRLWGLVLASCAESTSLKAACGRALASAWVTLGEIRRSGPTDVMSIPLVVATDALIGSQSEPFGLVPDPDSVVAILSATWKAKPLLKRACTMHVGTTESVATLESILEACAQALDTSPGSVTFNDSEATFMFRVTGAPSEIEVSVPLEAALLRSKSKTRAKLARFLAHHVGPRDGRLYRLLCELAAHANSTDAMVRLGRAACASAFRALRHDPLLLLTWGSGTGSGLKTSPYTMDELAELLSEPKRSIGDTDLMDELTRRCSKGGVWSKRSDQGGLLELAGRYPGPVATLTGQAIVDGGDIERIQEHYVCLANSDSLGIGALAQGVSVAAWSILKADDAQATSAAASLTGFLSRCASSAFLSPNSSGASGTLADLESGMWQVMIDIVRRIAFPLVVTDKDCAWLSGRLWEWWLSQLHGYDDPKLYDACRQVVDAGLESSADVEVDNWSGVRIGCALNALLDVVEVAGLRKEEGVMVRFAPLIDHLVALAGYNGRAELPELLRSAWWHRSERPDVIATHLVMWIEPSAFFRLPPEARLRVIEEIPHGSASLEGRVGLSSLGVLRAFGIQSDKLGVEERRALKDWLRSIGSEPRAQLWKLILGTDLFRVGELDLELLARDALLQKADHKTAVRALATYVVGSMLHISPERRSTVLADLFLRLVEQDRLQMVRESLSLAFAEPDHEPALKETIAAISRVPQVESADSLLRMLLDVAAETRAGSSEKPDPDGSEP